MIEIDGFSSMKEALERMREELATDEVPEDTLFDARVIAHELLTNALVYGGGRAYLSYRVEGSEVCITVRGVRAFRPPERAARADVSAERGRGLYLVDRLSVRKRYSEEDGVSVFVKIEIS